MKIPPLLLSALLFLLPAVAGPAPVQESPPPSRPDTAGLLRDALFDEEALRDPLKAAAGYEKVIAAYDAERVLAATALYRLAEVRRAQNQNDQAAALYQRLLTEFPADDPLARLSRENLAALGIKELPPASSPVPSEEDGEIEALRKVIKNSPDTLYGGLNSPLIAAAGTGKLKMVNFLLDEGIPPSLDALSGAARAGHLAVCEALVARGANIDQSGALLSAINTGRTAVVRFLLSKGADPNLTVAGDADNPLSSAVSRGHQEIIDLLLEAKANPNLPPPALSPLFIAVHIGDLKTARTLLKIGADPQVHCLIADLATPIFSGPQNIQGVAAPPQPRAIAFAIDGRPPYQTTTGSDGWSLLHAAVASRSLEMLDFVLSTSGSTDINYRGGPQNLTPLALAVTQSSPDLLEPLLKAGAKPDVSGPDGSPILAWAALAPEAESMVKFLLAAGADPKVTNASNQSVLSLLTRDAKAKLPVIRLLIAAGADPTAGESPLLDQLFGAAAVPLARDFLYPKWAQAPEITVSLPESASHWSFPCPAGPDSFIPPPLADLLLEWFTETTVQRLSAFEPDWTTLHLFRRDAGGDLQETILTDFIHSPLPTLQWGDVLEFVSSDWTANRPQQNLEYVTTPPSPLTDKLQASLVRQVTVTLNGRTHPMTLRGGLRVYNPLKPEAPLTDAVSLMKMMGAADPQWFRASVKVTRRPDQGGGEISTTLEGGSSIPLKEGDALELTGEPVLAWFRNGDGVSTAKSFAAEFRTSNILLSPGLPFSRTIPNSYGAPTLFQFLAAAWAPLPAAALEKLKLETSEDPAKTLPDNVAVALVGQENQLVLPHPDWSRITIRRAGAVPPPFTSTDAEVWRQKYLTPPPFPTGPGKASEIQVDLASLIAACTDATTPEQARQSDVELLQGDVVSIPVLQDRRDQPWTGFDPATIRFFSKALACRITLADADGSFRGLDLDYQPVTFTDSPAGLLGISSPPPAPNQLSIFSIPVLLETTAPDRMWDWLQRSGSGEKILPGSTNEPPKWFWLRNGDNIGIRPVPSSTPGIRGALPVLPRQPGQPGPVLQRRAVKLPTPGN